MSETPDVNSITAGTYELVSVQWDQRTSKPGEPLAYTRHVQGDTVTLDQAEARRLVLAGAVVVPGAREKAQAQLLAAQLQQVLARLPEDQRTALQEQFAKAQPAPDAADPAGGTGPGAPPERPAKAADKGAWVEYVVARGLATPEEAAKLTRDDLQALVPADS